MSRRRFAVLATVLVAVNVFFWLAESGFALPTSGGLVQTLFGGRLIRAEVLWLNPDGKVQDTRLDRGVVLGVSPDSVLLREKDASLQTIPLSPNVTVRAGLQTGTVANLRRGMRVVVSRQANAPADVIQIEGVGGG